MKGMAESMMGNHQVCSAWQLFLFVSWVKPRAFTLCFLAKHSSLTSFMAWFSIYWTVVILFTSHDDVCLLCVCGYMYFWLDIEVGRAVAQIRSNKLPS